MPESVAELRARWTPETTAAAIEFLQGRPVDYNFAKIEWDGVLYTDLRGLSIEQTQLDGAVIDHCIFRWSTFHDIGFKDAKLLSCNISHSNFELCYFRRTLFHDCNIINGKFSTCDFSNAHIDHSKLDFASFHQCEIRLEDIQFRSDAQPQTLVRVCRNLKLNAMSMGHFSDAGELTYREKTYDRAAIFAEAFSKPQKNLAIRLRHVFDWLSSVFLNLIWGYGEKPSRLLLTIIIAILFFGSVQFEFGGIPGKTYWEHVYFSGITFLTIGYGDLSPVGTIPRFVAVVEGAAGISVLGLLIASATKKIMYR